MKIKGPIFVLHLATLIIFTANHEIRGNNKINTRIQHYTAENGLSQNFVDCIFKDSRGFIWLGTGDGLNRFDGYRFIAYRPVKGENSISNGYVNDIAEDKDGNLWIATRNGINKFNFTTESFIHFFADSAHPEKSISDNQISTIMFDRNGDLWIGTLKAGVEKLILNNDLTGITAVKKFNIDFVDDKSITSENIYCLLEDHQGMIYIGSVLGLDKYNPETGEISKYTDMDHPLYFSSTVVHCLYEDNRNVLWVGTESGLISIDHKAGKIKQYEVDRISPPGTNKKALSHGLIKSIHEDINHNMLIGTLGGLHKLDTRTNEFSLFPDNNHDEYSLNNKFINDIYCDNEGNVWIGTEKGGINKYNDYQKKFYYMDHDPDVENGLNNNIINSIVEDENYLWIGTAGGGLNRFDKKRGAFSHFVHNSKDVSSISLNYVSALAQNSEKNIIWAGTWGCGVNIGKVYENKAGIDFKTELYDPEIPHGPPFSYISSLLFDDYGNLWIGGQDGLRIYDAKDNKFYTMEPGSQHGGIIRDVGCIFIDHKKNLWVGTTTGLLMIRLKDKKDARSLSKPDSVFTYVHDNNDPTSLGSNFIVSIYQDKTKNLWFSTYGNGISKLEKLSSDGLKAGFSHFTNDNGLSNNVVYGMLEDDHHNLWLSTDRGLTKYNYITQEVFNYYETDGLQSNQFYWSAYYKNKDGLMYFGGTKGLNYFYPDSILKNPNKPVAVITDFKIFNQHVGVQENGKLTKTISETDEIILDYNENIISFEFASLCYFAPEKNLFKYKMENFDNSWTQTNSDRRYVTYTNLDPGTYYFKVHGSNNDGEWSGNPATIKLIVKPPWWKTIWSRLLMIMLFLGLIALVFYLRVRGFENKKRELKRLVKERTRELDESNKDLTIINKTQDKLFAIIAHDLRNPFNVILGMFDLLVKNFDKYDDNRKKEMLQTLKSSSTTLYRLLENLLEWSRSQTGNLEFIPDNFNLNDLIQGNIHLIKNQAKEKNIEIQYNFDERIMVLADKNLLNTILRNLLNNAIKFTENGRVTIHLEKRAEKNMAVVHITDTGTGIPEKNIDLIFEVGKLVSNTGTQGEKGSGLGLMLCKEFVQKNGGEIWVDSKPGEGSTFSFSIPLGKLENIHRTQS